MTKAMLFAAGRGERMGDLTKNCPKPLLKVREQALIVYHLKKLVAIGIKDCLINLHYLPEKIVEVLGDGSQFGLRLHYSRENEKLETAGGVIQALDFFERQPFLLMSADVFSDYPLESLLNKISVLQEKEIMGHLVLVDNPSHHLGGDFHLQMDGLLSMEGEKLNYAGMCILHPDVFLPYPPGYRKIGDVFKDAIKKRQLTGEYYAGSWMNIDTPERLRRCEGRLEPHD